jgi:general L-amino acid transport system substrate-binding protein
VPPLTSRLPVVAQVGTCGEIFGRNLGRGTPPGIDRSVNALWTQGGLLRTPPLR